MCILWNKSVSIQLSYPFDPGVQPFIKKVMGFLSQREMANKNLSKE